MMLERSVINSGPLIALSLIDQLDLLPILFSEFWIPETVYQEVTVAGIGQPGAKSLSDKRWHAHVIREPEPDPLLIAELDAGEAAVISLARAKSPCMVIIDEKRGRQIAKQVYDLPVKGSVGLLLEAKRRGELTELHPILLELKRAGYYLSDAVIQAACLAASKH